MTDFSRVQQRRTLAAQVRLIEPNRGRGSAPFSASGDTAGAGLDVDAGGRTQAGSPRSSRFYAPFTAVNKALKWRS
jgi:hypothetical protein